MKRLPVRRVLLSPSLVANSMRADTKFALQCWRRKQTLEKRFKKAQIETGKVRERSDHPVLLLTACTI